MFKKLFGSNKSTSEKKESKKTMIDWVPLKTVEEVKAIKNTLKGNVGIFKHSTRCGISTTVISRFEKKFPKDLPITMYYIDLLNYRDVSSAVGQVFNVIHQSPQFLVIKDGKAIAHESHHSILGMDFNEIIK